uniref:receptor protein-tyrosine kinase n=1 Tax=Ditylenchus dipsaci TaxID=166011 RepID=A0A915EDW1_9BILA
MTLTYQHHHQHVLPTTIATFLFLKQATRDVCRMSSHSYKAYSVIILLPLIFELLIDYSESATVFSSSLQSCQDQCIDRNIAFPLPKGNLSWNILASNCDFNCHIESCRAGCQDLDSPVNSTCEARCGSVKSQESCQQGCRAVSDIFLHQIQDLLLNQVCAEVTLDVTQGVRLNWSFDTTYASTLQEISSANLRWFAQSRIGVDTARHGWKWTPLDPKAFKEGGLESVVLVPFEDCSEIQVRLVAIWRETVVVSRTFSQILLFPASTSASSHLLHNYKVRELAGAQLQTSSNSFVLCWQSDHFREVHTAIKFRVRLIHSSTKEGDHSTISTYYTTASCHLFRNLPQENCCSVGIAAVLSEGGESGAHAATTSSSGVVEESAVSSTTQVAMAEDEKVGEELMLNISVKPIRDAFVDDVIFLLFTNGTAILHINNINDYVLSTEPSVIPFAQLVDGKIITALASISQKDLLVGLSDGSVHTLDISSHTMHQDNSDGNATKPDTLPSEKIKEADGVAIVQLVVDHMQGKIYVVREKNALIRCPTLRSCENATSLMTSNSLSFIQSIAVDTNNVPAIKKLIFSFLYYITNTGDTFSTPLFPVDSPPLYTLSITRRLAEIPPVASIEVDSMDQKLVCVLRNGSLFTRDLINDEVLDERASFNGSDTYKGVIRSQYHNNRLFWISKSCGDSNPWASCLFAEERNSETQTIHLNPYLYAGPVHEFVIMKNFQPPAFIAAPSKIGLTMDDSTSRLNWKPPMSFPFQASGSSWRALSYDSCCHPSPDLSSSSSTISTPPLLTTITTIALGSANVTSNVTDVLLPLLPNTTGVYTAKVRVCSWNICSIPAKVSNKALRSERFMKTIAFYTKQANVHTPEESTGLSNTVASRYNVLDAVGREIQNERLSTFPMMPLEPETVIAFDNSTGALYAASKKEISIFRLLENGLRYRFLDFLSINHLAVMSSRSLIWLASSYAIVGYRLTSSFEKVVYNCVNEDCGEVVGLATDDLGLGRVFYFLQLNNGTVQLFHFNDVQPVPQFIGFTEEFYRIRQMAIADDKIFFLTEDGQVGSFDLKFSAFNFNLALREVAFLLSAEWTQPSENNRVHFKGPIEFESNGELSWNVEPSVASPGQILYKIQLYRDTFGGDRTVDITQANHYKIPANVLDSWTSRQKFDVLVDAITPWIIFSANKTAVNAPTKPPSRPTNLKIYATQQKTVDGTRAIIDLFWDEPKEWNGDMLGYTVNCSLDDGSNIAGNISFKHSRAFSFPIKSGKIGCAVAANNEQNLIGAYSEQITIDGSDFRPLIRLFAIDSTDSLVSIQNWTTPASETPSTNKRARRQNDLFQYQTIAFIGNELYAIRKEGSDSSQLFLVLLDMNDIENVVYKGSLNGDFNGGIQAMTSDWVANRLLLVANHELMQISLDSMQQLTLITAKKLFTLSAGAQDAKQLIFDPFINAAYLLTKNGSLFKLDLNKNTEDNLALSLDCLKSQTVTSMVGEFVWNKAASPLIYALTWNGMIALNPSSSGTAPKCSDINVNWNLFSSDKGLKAISSFTVADKLFIFFTSNELLIYDRNSALVSPVPITNPPLRQILAASQSSQPYPDRSCFMLPPPNNINFTVKNTGRTGSTVEVQEPTALPTNCQNISFPQTQYEIQFKKKDTGKMKIILNPTRVTHIENGILDKDTSYDVSVSWYNRYNPSQGMSEAKLFKTGYGFPTAPLDPVANPLTPDTVLLNWKMPSILNAPTGEIRYRVTQLSSSLSSPVPIGVLGFENNDFSSALSELVTCSKNPCQVKIPNLRASVGYQFWVTAIHISNLNSALSDADATSLEAQTQTMDIPGTLRLDNATSESLFLRWSWLNPSSTPSNLFVQYKQSGVDASWIEFPNEINSTFDPVQNLPSTIVIGDLHSATNYDYRYKAQYTEEYAYDGLQQKFVEMFYPQAQQARTKAGTPSAPLDVTLVEDKDGLVLKWSSPKTDGGEPVLTYAVEFSQSEWEIAERGLPAERLSWSTSSTHRSDEFRVRAANVEGFGSYGSTVTQTEGEEMTGMQSNQHTWLYITLLVISLVLMTCMVFLLIGRSRKLKRMRRKAKIHKSISLENITSQIQFPNSPDKFTPEVENEIRNLPYIQRHSIQTLKNRPLGKGSFGEVIEGIFKEFDPRTNRSNEKDVRVAIKYLKNDSEENRLKFLKEAVTMNNFDHPNIIKLIGVYRETQPHMLVFELMEGGDLHTFLIIRDHQKRPAHSSHVHRDLAARNCLISSKTSPQRVTKIGDFGLAREMFSSDYYKVHGADFLPLRWLSPESAMQGIFTSKTDVWSFGIVLWEIMTLGTQPYPGINNMEVLIRLKEGQTLERPQPECPDEIYEIMRSTWILEAEKRPRFVDLMPKLEALRSKPHLQSTESFPSSLNSFTNNAFENSQDSMSSFSHTASNASGSVKTVEGSEPGNFELKEVTSRFDKSDNRSGKRHGKLPKLLRPTDFRVDRPSSSTSAETITTTLDYDYEIPRSRTATGSAEGSHNYNRLSSKSNLPRNPHSSTSIGEFFNEGFVGDSGSVDSSSPSKIFSRSAFTDSLSTLGDSKARQLALSPLRLADRILSGGEVSTSLSGSHDGSSSKNFTASTSSAPREHLPDSPSRRIPQELAGCKTVIYCSNV